MVNSADSALIMFFAQKSKPEPGEQVLSIPFAQVLTGALGLNTYDFLMRLLWLEIQEKVDFAFRKMNSKVFSQNALLPSSKLIERKHILKI